MPVTLAEAKLNVQDALQMGVIDEFRKSNWILDHLIFDDAVSPTGGGATLTYSYTRLKTQPTAGFRDINTEYSPSEVTKERHSVDIKIFGGSYKIDRVIANMGGIISEVELQQSQKIKAAQALFNDTFINGDSATDSKAFDGLEKALKGSSTEYNANEDNTIDLSTSEAVTTNYTAFLDMLDEFLTTLDGTPSFIAGNTKLISKLRACARRAAMYQVTKNDWGQQVESYNGIPFVDLGTKPGTNEDVVKTDPSKGTTSLYVARIGLDGLHGVSMAGVAPVQTWLPDFTTAGAVKTGEVEMNAAIALKASKAAGVFRNIKVK
ncbi:phage capsid protein [Clostridium baratii]